MPKTKYQLVNWIDGMKINKDHFIQTENTVHSFLHRNASAKLNPYNYGLVPPYEKGQESLKISVDMDGQDTFHVRVNTCTAITSGGAFIDIFEPGGGNVSFDVTHVEAKLDLSKAASENYYLIMTVDPFTRVPSGEADPEETPPRNPFVIPEYKVSLVPLEEINAAELGVHFLVIGVVKVKEGQARLVDEYVPPCASVRSHTALLDFHDRVSTFTNNLEKNIITIIKKIHSKKQQSSLSESVHVLSAKLLDFLSTQILEHKWINADQPPVFMVEMLARFTRLMRNTMETLPPESKEEMINYFSDWCNLKQGEFEELLLSVINHKYEHEDIAGSLIELARLMEVISVLFDTLSGLDYIGKRKETQIFVKEEQKPKRSFLADD
jgi:hypothetical protein